MRAKPLCGITLVQLTAEGLRGYTTCMGIHSLAGQPAPASVLVDVSKLIAAYFSEKPDAMVREHRVAFGTSGHRGSAFKQSFNDWFAARPSGTEDAYKLYTESFRGKDHLRRIQEEARALVAKVFSDMKPV